MWINARSSNGRTRGSGPRSEGSSPSRAVFSISTRRYRLGVRTGGSQPPNRGSNPRSGIFLPIRAVPHFGTAHFFTSSKKGNLK